MAKNENVKLKKGRAQFMLIGKFLRKVGKDGTDYSFNLDKVSDSGYKYSNFKMRTDCGNGNEVYSEMMGGHHTAKEQMIYCHGKKLNDDGKEVDDWATRVEVAWEDRFNETILDTVGDMCFIKIGIEKDIEGNTVVKKFLSEYDAIQYIHDNLTDGAIVNVKGNLSYSKYNDNIQTKKQIKSIFLSKMEEEKDFKAEFTQTILVDKNSIKKTDIENKKIVIDARVLDYMKEVKGNIPYNINFELHFEDEKEAALVEKMSKILFAPKKDIDEVTIIGKFVESLPLVNIKDIDVTPEIQELIDMGILDEEDVKKKAVGNGKKQRKMVILRPDMLNVDKEGITTTSINRVIGKYKEEDLIVTIPDEEEKVEEVVAETQDDGDINNVMGELGLM